MGLVLGMLSPNVPELVCGWHYQCRGERVARRAYELDFQGLRLDVLGTVREEVRDQVFVIVSSLDNLMVVATLMLTIGFGFVVEGTFPPIGTEAWDDWDLVVFMIDPLVVYSILCALSLVCPFWCVILTMTMKYEVDGIIREHMRDLKKQILYVLERKRVQAPDKAQVDATSFADPSFERTFSFREDVPKLTGKVATAVCPRRAHMVAENAVNALRFGAPQLRDPLITSINSNSSSSSGGRSMGSKHGGFPKLQESETSPDSSLAVDTEDILRWAKEDLMCKLRLYGRGMWLARVLLWMGLHCALWTCSLLLGLYMRDTYQKTRWMWRAYTSITSLSGLASMLYLFFCWVSGTTSRGAPCSPKPSDWVRLGRIRTPESPRRMHRTGTGDFSSSPQPQQTCIRVRQRGSTQDPWKRIPINPMLGWSHVQTAVQEKLTNSRHWQHAHASAGGAAFQKACKLESLVRLKDNIVIEDDGDVSALHDGDQCEAILATAPAFQAARDD